RAGEAGIAVDGHRLTGAGGGLEGDRGGLFAAIAEEGDAGVRADGLGGEAEVEGARLLDRLPVDAEDDVTGLEASAFGGAAGGHLGDEGAARQAEAEAVGDVCRHLLRTGAEPGPDEFAAGDSCFSDD